MAHKFKSSKSFVLRTKFHWFHFKNGGKLYTLISSLVFLYVRFPEFCEKVAEDIEMESDMIRVDI